MTAGTTAARGEAGRRPPLRFPVAARWHRRGDVVAQHSLPGTDPLAALGAPAPIDLGIAADPEAGRRARRALAPLAAAHLAGARVSDLHVAVGEAVNNVVLHAYGAADRRGLRVKAWPLPVGVAVLVADAGRGFDPGADGRRPPAQRGMGLHVMRRLASEVRIVSQPGAGAIVLMVFRP